jgi:hypothetical protein
MKWHRLASGPHAGRTVPEVFFLRDPDYVLDGFEAGLFNGAMLAEAAEVCRLATHIRVPRGEDEDPEVVVLYHLLPDGSFGGFVIVAKSDPRLAEYERFSAARSDGFDVAVPRRIAPGDAAATKGMVEAVLWHYFGDPHAELTAAQCAAFFENEGHFLVESYLYPRIESFILRGGTRYFLHESGRRPTPRFLDHATEVKVVTLALGPGEVGRYALPDGSDIFVRFEDEVRGDIDGEGGER